MNSVSSPNIFSPKSPDTNEEEQYFSSEDYSLVMAPQLIDIQMKLAVSNSPGPYLQIVEQPVEKFRFRYKSEMMGTHGSILAKSAVKSRRRIYPTVKLHNFEGEAIIRCSIYTAHPNELIRIPHTHRLVVREGNDDKDDPHELNISAENHYTAVFKGMGIIHTARKHIADELARKNCALRLEQLRLRNVNVASLSTKEEAEIKSEALIEAKRMNLNSVTLCFEAFEERPNGVRKKLCDPVFSTAINNMKSALTGELKICRVDRKAGCCSGGDEIFILVEKVGKKNIKIKFFELDDDDNETWCDFGKFSELDVHHQYAIVFRTPPYKDVDITEKVDVFLQLYRPTDGDCSEPIQFTYKPSEKLGRKRQRISLNENFSKYLDQDKVLADDLVKLSASGTPSLSSSDKIFTSLNDVRIESQEFEEFMKNFSNSGNIVDYLDSLPPGPQGLCNRFMDLISTDSVKSGHEETSGKSSNASLLENSCDVKPVIQKEFLDEGTLARQIIDEMKRNASLKKPVFTERVFRLFIQKSEDGNCALHAAVIHGQKNLLKEMLDVLSREPKFSLLNCLNNKQQTPLHIAAADQPQLVRLLLKAGADPDKQDADGNTPLHLASKYNSNECVDELLAESNYKSEIKADLNKKNSSGWTPLHLSVIHKNHEIVKKLVAAGADVNEGDTNGRTVLHLAAEENDDIITAFLMNHTNIDANKQDLSGYTALDRARATSGKKQPSQLCDLLGDLKVTSQMDTTEFDFTKIKLEPMDSDDELHIDEDDDEEEDDEDDDEEEEVDDEESNKETQKDKTEKKMQSEKERKQILSLLEIVGHTPERKVESPELPEVKEERLASPVSECTIPDENGLFGAEILTKLCDILDASGSWADLADLVGYNFIIPSIRDAPSPSKLLFHYMDVDGNVSIHEIRTFLSLLDEERAAEIVDSVISKDS